MPNPNSGKTYFSYKVPPPIYGYDTSNPMTQGLSTGSYKFSQGLFSPEQAERDLLSWLSRTYREGLTALTSEPAWPHIQRSIDYIYKQKQEEISSLTSTLSIPQVKSDISEIVATYANIRPIPDFQCPSGAELEAQQRILNNLYIDWHITNSADRWYKTGIQNGAIKGTGWLATRWTKDNLGVSGEGRVVIDNYDHKEVVPIQLGKDKEIQNAYGCHIVNTDVPIARAHAMWPNFQDKLIPDRSAPQIVKKVAKRLGRVGSVALAMFSPTGKIVEDGSSSAPALDIFHTYVKDQAINESGSPILIGGGPPLFVNNSWAYYVPSYLSATGGINRVPLERPYLNPSNQQWVTDREVTKEECRIYPRGRLIIWTRSCVLSDGPNPYWHGRFPVAKICLDSWPDTFLGFPLTLGPIDIEQTINKLIRCIEDSCMARLNPPMQSDDAIDENLAEKIVPKIPGQKWRINSLLGTGITFPFASEFYDVPDFIPKFIEYLAQKIKDILGLGSVQAMAMARQTPAADTLQKVLEMMGPIVEDRSRAIESAIEEIGNQLLSHFFQFYDFTKRLRILGPDGIAKEDIDFDPLTLVPDHLPGKTRAEKAILHMRRFKFLVSPRSLHEINSLSRKMLYLQLQRGGYPIDSQTVGEACDIPRLGTIPGDTVFEKYINEQKAKVEVGIELQALQAQKVPSQQSAMPEFAMNVLQTLLGGQNGGNPSVGRKPTAQDSPQIVEKDQGMRSTISESGR